jgi:hypothetical protein
MQALERHLDVVARDGIRVTKRVEVASANDEPTVFLEATGRIERMDDRKAGHATGLEHARNFPNGAAEVIDVMQAHERDDLVERRILERERGCIGHVKLHVRSRLARGGDERGRSVDANHAMAERCQMPREPALSAADVERTPAGSGDEREELIAMIAVVAIVPERASPRLRSMSCAIGKALARLGQASSGGVVAEDDQSPLHGLRPRAEYGSRSEGAPPRRYVESDLVAGHQGLGTAP